MHYQERNRKYNEYLEQKIPKTREAGSLFSSFWVGGLICCLGQGINDLLLYAFPTLAEATAWGYTLIILIFLGSFLTAIGVYDRIGKYAGGGSIVPITGFSNSITSPALDFKAEGIIFGMCVKMFSIAGLVIVIGFVASTIVGLLYLIF
ncbi:MAG: SpoVA/SpoVAEb family sporulation membrane protein [Clostridia bacterium]|nr:SpoVA/SpoVAEb family sporulation membrane protein [Clostridia bacterium]